MPKSTGNLIRELLKNRKWSSKFAHQYLASYMSMKEFEDIIKDTRLLDRKDIANIAAVLRVPRKILSSTQENYIRTMIESPGGELYIPMLYNWQPDTQKVAQNAMSNKQTSLKNSIFVNVILSCLLTCAAINVLGNSFLAYVTILLISIYYLRRAMKRFACLNRIDVLTERMEWNNELRTQRVRD